MTGSPDHAQLLTMERSSRRRAEHLQRIATALSKAATRTEVAEAFVEHAVATTEALIGAIWMIVEGRALVLLGSRGLADDSRIHFARIALDETHPAADCVRGRSGVFLESRAVSRTRYPAFEAAVFRSSDEIASASLPLLIGEASVGAISFSFSTERGFGEDDRAFFDAVAQLAAHALERARLADDERARLALLARTSSVLSASLEEAPTLEQVARLAIPDFADLCWVDIVRGDERVERVAVAHAGGATLEQLAQRLAPSTPSRDAPVGVFALLRDPRPQLVPHVTAEVARAILGEGDRVEPDALDAFRGRAAIFVAIRGRERTLGSLVLLGPSSGRRYGESDVLLADDLAHRAGLAIENARLYQAVRRSDRAKTQFLAMLAHELRNPLAPVLTGARILRTSRTGRVADRALEAIDRQTQHLARLVDDLLDVSRIERGKIELRRTRVDLAGLAREAAGDFGPAIQEKGLTLAVDIPHEPLEIDGDPARLTQVIGSLLRNAMQFTEPGGKVAVFATGTRDTVALGVRDTGIGIARELLPTIFEPFTQAETSLARSRGGLGLGLAFVRGLVELHGGTIRVHSDGPGTGTEFVLSLPRLTRLVHAPGAAPSSERGQAPLRLLVVDPNRDAAEMLRTLLELDGHRVECAFDGEGATHVAWSFQPQVILCDLGLPRVAEIARRLRDAESPVRHAHLVAIAGHGDDGARLDALAVGFEHHLTKPIAPRAYEELLARLAPGARPT